MFLGQISIIINLIEGVVVCVLTSHLVSYEFQKQLYKVFLSAPFIISPSSLSALVLGIDLWPHNFSVAYHCSIPANVVILMCTGDSYLICTLLLKSNSYVGTYKIVAFIFNLEKNHIF